MPARLVRGARPVDRPRHSGEGLTLILSASLVTAAMLTAGCARSGSPPPDVILHGGRIVTVDDTLPSAEAVAIQGGRIIAVGTTPEVLDLAGSATTTIDLRGRTVVPGLADDHLHGAGGGPGVDLSRSRSLDDVLRALADRVAQSQPGDVIVTNSDWHEAQLQEQRLPLRRDLDRVAPDNPIVVVRGGHEYILNSAALARWSITEKTPVPEGGRISRYEDGTLNGELVDAAKSLVSLPAPPEKSIDERLDDLAAEHATLHAAGLTSVRYAGVSVEQYRLLEEMKRRGVLDMRVSVLIRPGRTDDAARVRGVLEQADIGSDEGDEWLRVVGIKLGVDGGFEGGWMRKPYEEPWGERGTFRGIQTMPAGRYTAIVREVHRLGWRVATHAVGDAAIDQVLDAYEAAHADRSITGRRWSIEHGFIPTEDQFARMVALGLVISAQNHLYLAGPSLVKYWGPERAAWTTPVRTYLDRGLVVAAGSDAPVVPYRPLWTLYHFITRDTITGGVLGANERITRAEALRLSTLNNAYLTFEEDTKGSITPGKLADLAVLSDDILTCPEDRIDDITVLMTMVGGRIVFEHEAFRRASE